MAFIEKEFEEYEAEVIKKFLGSLTSQETLTIHNSRCDHRFDAINKLREGQ